MLTHNVCRNEKGYNCNSPLHCGITPDHLLSAPHLRVGSPTRV